ncbi:MAG TPA: hypothetical protein VGM03_15105 [Phycisphaerae bacterium]
MMAASVWTALRGDRARDNQTRIYRPAARHSSWRMRSSTIPDIDGQEWGKERRFSTAGRPER